ncbi:MAG: serine/threonine protein kinase [Phycisphaerae bacterium]|nr:serine/threonine protein kinase [Phycisphaerae bacterium]
MADPGSQRDPVEILADEFIERHRQGERPTIDEYAERYPDLADDIRELFPTIAAMEGLKALKEESAGSAARLGALHIEQLGDFRIIREIGRGGMGIVYEAEQESLRRRVAVKVLPRHWLLDAKQLERFRREARTAAKLHHTNIVPVFGVGQQEDYHYYVMQFIRGVGLDEVLAQLGRMAGLDAADHPSVESHASRHAAGRADEVLSAAQALIDGSFRKPKKSGSSTDVRNASASADAVSGSIGPDPQGSSSRSSPTVDLASADEVILEDWARQAPSDAEPDLAPSVIPDVGSRYWQSVASIGLQVADALAYAHAQGTLHRDIKPGNLILDAHGVVWVADFGLAKAAEHDVVSQPGDIVGTLRYMAPEQLSGKSDARSDIYSLGLTLYELVAFRPAFDDTNRSRLIQKITQSDPTPPRRLNPEIPRDLETIVLKAIARDPADRYATASDLAGDLQCFLEDRPVTARRIGPIERLWRWSRRNRAVAGLAGTALVLLIMIAVVASVGYVRTRSANVRARDALARESLQREKAEATSELILDALDTLFKQFAPKRVTSSAELTVGDSNSVSVEVPIQPVLSNESAALLERMLVFYDRLAEQGGDDARLQRKVAEANRRIGDIRQRLGDSDKAKAAYLRAIDLFEKLEASSPGEAVYPLEVARTYNELGSTYGAADDRQDANECYTKAREILESIAPPASSSPDCRYELARAYFLLGRRGLGGPGGPGGPGPGGPGPGGPPGRGRPDQDGQSPGRRRWMMGAFRPDQSPPPPDHLTGGPPRPPGPEDDQDGRFAGRRERSENLDKAISLLKELVSEYPSMPDYRHLLALCYREIPFGRPGPDLEAFRDAVNQATEILEGLVRDFPDVPEYRYDLAEIYAMPGGPKASSFEDLLRVGEQRLRTALDISEKLVAERPNIPDYQTSLVRTHHKLAEILRRTGKLDEAEKLLRTALDIQTSLAKRFPDVPSYQAWVALLQESLAGVLKDEGKLAESRALVDSAITQATELSKRRPEMRFMHGLLAHCHMTLAEVLRLGGEKELADKAEAQARQHHDHMRRGPPRGADDRGPRHDRPHPTSRERE